MSAVCGLEVISLLTTGQQHSYGTKLSILVQFLIALCLSYWKAKITVLFIHTLEFSGWQLSCLVGIHSVGAPREVEMLLYLYLKIIFPQLLEVTSRFIQIWSAYSVPGIVSQEMAVDCNDTVKKKGTDKKACGGVWYGEIWRKQKRDDWLNHIGVSLKTQLESWVINLGQTD